MLLKFSGGVVLRIRNIPLDFGIDPDPNHELGLLTDYSPKCEKLYRPNPVAAICLRK